MTLESTGKKQGRGRPSYKPTEEHKSLISALVVAGCNREQMAAAIGISPVMVSKYYGKELETAKLRADAMVTGKLMEQIRKGNVACIIFYAKTRMGWREHDIPTQATGQNFVFQFSDIDPKNKDEILLEH